MQRGEKSLFSVDDANDDEDDDGDEDDDRKGLERWCSG